MLQFISSPIKQLGYTLAVVLSVAACTNTPTLFQEGLKKFEVEDHAAAAELGRKQPKRAMVMLCKHSDGITRTVSIFRRTSRKRLNTIWLRLSSGMQVLNTVLVYSSTAGLGSRKMTRRLRFSLRLRSRACASSGTSVKCTKRETGFHRILV